MNQTIAVIQENIERRLPRGIDVVSDGFIKRGPSSKNKTKITF